MSLSEEDTMNATVQEKFYTAEEFWEISHRPAYKGKRLRLIEGVLVEMSPAGGKHGGLALKLGRLVGDHVEEHDLGYTTAAETGYILFKNPNGKDTVQAPDAGFVAAHRLPNGLPDGYLPFAPDLAVEVVSPNDSADDIQDKVTLYLKYGTRLVWVFYPRSQTVVAHTPNGSRSISADGTLDGEDVLPGFSVKVRDIFK
jgi:Uma2 family endonuclease